MMKSPFKFLDSYTKDDRGIFFGRDREIEELYQKVFDSKLLLVYGVSGTGKSSLIHCGLANKFNEADWLPLVVRRGENIVDSMASSIRSSSITLQQGSLSNPAEFKKSVRSLYLDHYKPVFFIFDQFEELFIFGDKEERKLFIQIVKSLIESDLQCRLIFVMREEYMAGVTEFEKYIPTFFSNRVRIEKMSHVNAIDAIKEPCKVFNISHEEGFAEALLEKLSPGSADVELTYLQVFLDKVFRLAVSEDDSAHTNFTLSALNKIGNVSNLLGSFLDEQISLLTDPETAMAILKSFVSMRGTKKQMASEEVKEYARTLGNPVEDSLLLELLQTFVNLRILRDKDQNEKYELRHDDLASKIYEKFTLVEKEILEIRQFIENSWNTWQKRKVLISAADLEYIAPYESRLFLPAELTNLIATSKSELKKKTHRRNLVISGAVIGLVFLLSVFSIWALNERGKAVSQEKLAMEAKNRAIESETKATKAREVAENELYNNIRNNWTVTPLKINILYAGIGNPVRITASGISSERIFADVTNGIISRSGDDFIIRPAKSGKCVVNTHGINAKGDTLHLGSIAFRVKNIPSPVIKVAGVSGGFINKVILLSSNGLYADYENFEFDVTSKVIGFNMSVTEKGFTYDQSSTSDRFTDRQRDMIQKAVDNQKIYFEQIKVALPDGSVRDAPDMVLKIYDPILSETRNSLVKQYLAMLSGNDIRLLNPMRRSIMGYRSEIFLSSLFDSINIRYKKLDFRNNPLANKTAITMLKEILFLKKSINDITKTEDKYNAQKLSLDNVNISIQYINLNMPDSALYYSNQAFKLDSNEITVPSHLLCQFINNTANRKIGN